MSCLLVKRILRIYKPILDKFHGLPLSNGSILALIKDLYEVDWTFVRNISLTRISKNIVYHQVIRRYEWVHERLKIISLFGKFIAWWMPVIQRGWHFSFNLYNFSLECHYLWITFG